MKLFSRRTLLTASATMLAVPSLAVPVGLALVPTRFANPYEVAALRARKGKPGPANAQCPAMSPPARDLVVPDFYADPPIYSRIDRDRLEARNALVRPIEAISRNLTSSADRWAQSVPADARHASCAVAILDAMAQADSTLGQVNIQGGFERKWMFCALALAHLKIVSAEEYSEAAQDRVRTWFARYLPHLRETYDKPPGRGPAPSMQLNNHATWAGICAMALALAVGDEATWHWGISRIRLTLDQVDAQGFLPLEVLRGAKALHYHSFTLGPLALAAFLARPNGVDLAGAADGPFHRLAKRTHDAYVDPSAFEARTGKTQEPFSRFYDMAWVEIYAGEFARPEFAAALGDRRPQFQSWLGGDLTLWHAKDR
ncbi:MAG: alginate lyase family protein [Magnetospirillum sp.]|jgi:poly(beta-D-mannuronate) lyase|nr:alginate lyase family protein [Magnetospirillum sp.]